MGKRRIKKRYRAKTRLWHSAEGRAIAPGDEIDLSHLEWATIQQFLDRGIVEEIVEQEEENGTDDRCDFNEGL